MFARDVSEGKGMFSVVLKCELTFEDSINESDVYTTIIKIPSTGKWESLGEGKKLEDMEFVSFFLVITINRVINEGTRK